MEKFIHGVGFLINKTVKGSVFEYRPISSRLISIRLKAYPFNITIIEVYASTHDHDDEEVEEFYTQLQNIINMVSKEALKNWKDHCRPSCNEVTN